MLFFAKVWASVYGRIMLIVVIALTIILGIVVYYRQTTSTKQGTCTINCTQSDKTKQGSQNSPNNPDAQTPTTEAPAAPEAKPPTAAANNPAGGSTATGGGSSSGGSTGGGTGGGGSTTPPPSGGGGGTQSCPAYPAFPTASCTGVPAGVSLASNGSLSTTSASQNITGQLINGDLIINHNNVTVTNSVIKGRVVYNNHRGLTLRDVDLGPDSCPGSSNGGDRLIAGDDFTLNRVHLHNNGADLLALSGGGTVLIQDSLFDRTCYYASDHLDAIQYYDPGGVANVTLSHNTIDVRPSNTGGFGNAAIFWADFPGAGSRLNIYNNYVAGGNYTIYALDADVGSGVIIDISGNRFLRNAYTYGPCSLSNSIMFDGASGVKWTGNAFSDGAVIAAGDC